MVEADIRRLAQSYADRFNQLAAEDVADLLSDISAETAYWDDRTNLFALAADDPLDLALVLSAEAGGEDYVVVRWVDRWFVDETPVDWSSLEAAAFGDE
jgi:hypothetical protein